MPELQTIVAVMASSALTFASCVWYARRRNPTVDDPRDVVSEESVVFLFEGGNVIDATDIARRALEAAPQAATDLDRVAALLSRPFPNLRARLPAAGTSGSVIIEGEGGETRIEAERIHGTLRLVIYGGDTAATIAVDRHSYDAIGEELSALRKAADFLPYLIWKEDDEGAQTWMNGAYLNLLRETAGEDAASRWPTPHLFDAAIPGGPARRRASVTTTEGEVIWFDISVLQLDGETLNLAVPADAAVHAEDALKDFLQTLTKTFAHLSTGLAIFDKSRRLTLFNPALTDLTLIGTEFLCSRPTLSDFLDQLREGRMMPEPKDYRSWRKRIAALEAAAEEGTYSETWSLPTGQTYRVSGRPHPDGAIAFLFEDISAEISLTRRFRSELEAAQAVLDTFDDAIAVFSSGGTLTLSNKAYARLWGLDPAVSLSQISAAEAARHWSDTWTPSPVWADIREFICGFGARSPWSEPVTRPDGKTLLCKIEPVSGGATMIRFRSGASRNLGAEPTGFKSRRVLA